MKKMIPFICDYCKINFKREIRQTYKKHKHYFCSKKCNNLYKTTKIILPCGHCNKKVIRTKTEFISSKSGFIFCSHSCAASYNNTHKTTGIRVSKLELWLQTKLKEKFPQFKHHFNRKDTINSELDIFIPKLNLAFELNGIFHYEPIYGNNKLKQIQNNDNRKFQACLERNIELCIIDTSTMKKFKEEKAEKYFQIIKNIISEKLAVGIGLEPI